MMLMIWGDAQDDLKRRSLVVSNAPLKLSNAWYHDRVDDDDFDGDDGGNGGGGCGRCGGDGDGGVDNDVLR